MCVCVWGELIYTVSRNFRSLTLMIISVVASPIPPATSQTSNDRHSRGKDTHSNTLHLFQHETRDAGNWSSSVSQHRKSRGEKKSAFRFLFISAQEALTEWMNSDMNNSYSCSRVWMEIRPWVLPPQISVWNVPPPFAQHTASKKSKTHQIMPDGESFWQYTTQR